MAAPRIEFDPAAVDEAREAYRWYAIRSSRAADAFVAELDKAIEAIAERPDRYAAYLGGTRRYLLRRFPYFLVYRELSDQIQVVAVAHGRRRPGYWKPRL